MRVEVAHNLMRLLAEGTEDEETDLELRTNAVASYVDLLEQPHLPDALVKIICWVRAQPLPSQVDPRTSVKYSETCVSGHLSRPATRYIAASRGSPDNSAVILCTKLTAYNGHLYITYCGRSS